MELDELKETWQALDRQLQRRNAIDLQLFRERKLEKARSSLRPLFRAHIALLLFGIGVLVPAVAFWSRHLHEPVLFASGLILHIYGVGCIIVAGATLARIGGIDPDAPILVLQKRLAELRRVHIIGGLFLGHPWWLLWMPATTVLFGLLGADLSGLTVAHYLPGTLIGLAGLLATWLVYRWAHRSSRPRLARAMDDAMVGSSLRRAQCMLDEIEQFAQE